ncbi:hypothetical protein TWF696_001270 [Orbilia brochopaga]
MASSKKRESSMGEFPNLIDPNPERIRLSSPEPRFRLHESSMDAFLREFSPERYPLSLSPLGTNGRRPESPEGRTRSRTVTPSLDRDFDLRSLNITPEPILGHPSAGNFDSPPPYNADWSSSNDADKSSANPSTSSAATNANPSQQVEQQPPSPWYSEIPDGTSLVQFLDEIQPPSYPSLSVSPPERHTWAGDGKDESIWKSFVGYTPTEEEAAAYLRKAELESLALSKKQKQKLDAAAAAAKDKSRQKSPFSLRKRLEEEEEMAADGEAISPPSPTFGRPRRDTGAWWFFGRKGKGDADKDSGAKPTLDNDKPELFPRSTVSLTAESSSGTDQSANVLEVPIAGEPSSAAVIEQTPLGAIEAALPVDKPSSAHRSETPFQHETPGDIEHSVPATLALVDGLVSTDGEVQRILHEMEEVSQRLRETDSTVNGKASQHTVDTFQALQSEKLALEDKLQDARDAELDTPPGVCGICHADLRYREGEATGNWYLELKNHFENAHGSWAARMTDWFGTSDATAAHTTCTGSGDADLDVDMFNLEAPPADYARTEQPQEQTFDNPKAPYAPPEESKQDAESRFTLNIVGQPGGGKSTITSHLSEVDERSVSRTPQDSTFPSALKSNIPPLQWSRSHGEGLECYAFGCNMRFSTNEQRDEHMEAEHDIQPRPSRVDQQLSDNVRLLERLKTTDCGCPHCSGGVCHLAVDSAFPNKLDDPEATAVRVSEEVKSSEFKQLWHGFAASLKMKDDIQSGSVLPAYRSLNASLDDATSSSGYAPALAKLHTGTLDAEEEYLERMLEDLRTAPHHLTNPQLIAKDAHTGPDISPIAFHSKPEYLGNTSQMTTQSSRMKSRPSRKGKERAVEYQLQAESNFGAASANPKSAAADLASFQVRDPEAEDLSRVKLAAMNTRFLTAASNAYDKLLAGTQRPQASKEFKEFVESLGSVEDIVDVGMAVVDMILAEEVPRSLKMVYCFLHVAYAISQSESLSPQKTNELEFQAGLSVLRSCLPAFAEIAGMPSERDIFDEIANIMWEELEYALKWIETWDGNEALNKVGYSGIEVEGLTDFMRSHCSPDLESMAMDMTIDPKLLFIGKSETGAGVIPLETLTSTPSKISPLSSWEDVVGCGVFAIVVRFLKELKDTGIIFAYLCGGVCSSLATSFKKRVKFKDRATSTTAKLVPHLQRDVIAHLNAYKYGGVENVTSSAVSLLKQGYIRTIREFENCMVDLARVRRRTQEEFCAFVYAIVWHCNSCATFVPDNLWPSCRGNDDAEYSLQYVDERFHEETRWFSGRLSDEPESSASVQRNVDVIMNDIDNQPSVPQPDNAIDPLLPPVADETDSASPLNVGMCAIDMPVISTRRKLIITEDSPANSTASSSSPNNDSMWESSPHGLPGSETSFSNPNSNNVTPDEIYINPNLRNDRGFGSDYFSHPRPLATSNLIMNPVASPARCSVLPISSPAGVYNYTAEPEDSFSPTPAPCVILTVPSPANVYMAEAEDSFSPTPLVASLSNARDTQTTKSRKRKYLEGDGATSFPARRRKVTTTGKRLYCDVPGCEEFASTSSNLSRHKRTKHGNAAIREASYHCRHAGCDRVFYGTRGQGNLRTHMRKDHAGR